MTWRSDVVADPARWRLLARDANALHQLSMLCVPDGVASARVAAGVLFRAEHDGMVVQTLALPDWSRLDPRLASVRVVASGPALAAIRPGDRVSFRLVGRTSTARDGRRSAIGDADGRRRWLVGKLAGALAVESVDQRSGTVTASRRGAARAVVAATRFDGTGVVTDAVRLRELVETGVGGGRAFGLGLLTVARILP